MSPWQKRQSMHLPVPHDATIRSRLTSKTTRTVTHGLFALLLLANILLSAFPTTSNAQPPPAPHQLPGATPAQALANRALLMAARTGRDDLIQFAIDNGADPDARDEAQVSALMLAASGAHLSSVRALLGAGATVGAGQKHTGKTALMAAASTVTGYDIVVELIGAGASVAQTANDGYDALMAAAAHCRERTLELLLLNGAAPRSRTTTGRTALSLAAVDGNPGCIRRLLAAGADPNAKNDDTGSILVDAITAGHARAVASLLIGGADVNGFGRGTQTPLMLAVRSADLTLIAMLLEAQADPNTLEHGSGNTALMLAANLGYADIVEMLLQAGADPSIRAADGWNATQAALDIGEIKLAQRLEAFSAEKTR